jgi:hypothetical protein
MSKAKRATVTLYLTSKELYHLYNLLRDQIPDFDRSTREQIYSQLLIAIVLIGTMEDLLIHLLFYLQQTFLF